MAAMTEAEMLAALALVSDSDSDDDVGGGGSIVVPDATKRQVNLVQVVRRMMRRKRRRQHVHQVVPLDDRPWHLRTMTAVRVSLLESWKH